MTASAAPTAARAAASGTEHFQMMTTSGTGSTGSVIASGVFTAPAVDHEHEATNTSTFTFANGTILIKHSSGTGTQHFDQKTCLATAAASGGPVFMHGVLPPPPPGSTSAFNQAAEPQIRADQAGNFYISSENGLGAGTDAWSSANGGTAYGSLPQPNEVSSATGGTTGFAPGGGDTDLATGPVKNSAGTDNLYVASLTLGSVTVSLSQDGGHTWANDVTSATVPGDDREWIAAAGANGFYLSYHAIGTGDQIIVNQGQVAAGQPTTVQTYDAINPAQTGIYLGTVEDNEIGNIAVDPATGDVYQVFVGCPPSATAIATCSSFNTAYMAVGVPATTGGVTTLTFTDYVIFSSSDASAGFGNNFPAVAVDKAGNVYATWSDGQNIFLAF